MRRCALLAISLAPIAAFVVGSNYGIVP